MPDLLLINGGTAENIYLKGCFCLLTRFSMQKMYNGWEC